MIQNNLSKCQLRLKIQLLDKQLMVGDGVDGWTPFLRSIIDLCEELEELGVVYTNNKHFILKDSAMNKSMPNFGDKALELRGFP